MQKFSAALNKFSELYIYFFEIWEWALLIQIVRNNWLNRLAGHGQILRGSMRGFISICFHVLVMYFIDPEGELHIHNR